MIILTIITEYYLDAIFGGGCAQKECKSFVFNDAINKIDIFFNYLVGLKLVQQQKLQALLIFENSLSYISKWLISSKVYTHFKYTNNTNKLFIIF